MFKIFGYAIGLFLLVGGGYWVYQTQPQVRVFFDRHFTSKEFHTLEARFSAEQIMEKNRKMLLKDSKYSYLEPSLQFYPYALLEVKYSKESKTKEGILLWSLLDGELVIDTADWQTTHGFQDCINAEADKNDFKIIKMLAKNNNKADRDVLLRNLPIENETLDVWIDSCRQKKLIIQRGSEYSLHFCEPRFMLLPETKIDEWVVTKPSKGANCIPKRYTVSQITQTALTAFDNDFKIRGVTEVYLPVYNIVVQNPDGSVLTTHWNALNGKRIRSSYSS